MAWDKLLNDCRLRVIHPSMPSLSQTFDRAAMERPQDGSHWVSLPISFPFRDSPVWTAKFPISIPAPDNNLLLVWLRGRSETPQPVFQRLSGSQNRRQCLRLCRCHSKLPLGLLWVWTSRGSLFAGTGTLE